MRLWHESLLKNLSRQRLLSQHRECCALRGKGWNKKHSVVNYVFDYPKEFLVVYHIKVMNEMLKRGYNVDRKWYSINYQGKNLDEYPASVDDFNKALVKTLVYPEHNDDYLEECLRLLIVKNDIPYLVEWRNWQTLGT